MNEDVKRQALEEAERTYKEFISLAKKFSIAVVALIVFMFTQNWLVDGTGSQYDPSLYEEYMDNMKEMREEYE